MRKILTALCILMGLCTSAFATNYYVRLDGGTSAQCNGTVNAPYTSNGTSVQQGCAFNNPRYALGYSIENSVAGALKGGDTLYINGDVPSNTAQQAQYLIGFDDTSAATTPACSQYWSYDCQLNNIPAGTITQPTSIIGTGNHLPQLWGNERVWQVLQANNNYIALQNLEITDHDGCAYNDTTNGCDYNTYPYGAWAEDGLVMSGTGITLTNVYIHGVGRYGINTGNLGSVILTNVKVIGNGYGGITVGNNGSTSVTGTLTFNQPTIEWNGCSEKYPLSGTIVDNPSNYQDCFGQASGGYGDGLAFGANGNQNAGNWVIIGPGSISFNTQDGLDTLHGNGNGTIQIDKMRFEGNAGNQVKINALNGQMTSSVVIGDCGWWTGAPQSAPGAMQNGDACRALGNTISYFTTAGVGTVDTFYNNTILGEGNVQILQNGTCDKTTILNVKNNIIVGGYDWGDDTAITGSSGGNSQITLFYNAGTDGNGSGCSGNIINEDYNIITGNKNNNQGCNGTHDKCGTSPGFTGSIPMGTSGGALSTYYQGTNATSLVSLASTSPAIDAGVIGLTYWNNSIDYNGNIQTNPPTIGAEVLSGTTPTPPCVSNGTCNAVTPACGVTTTGTDNCGNTCTKVGATCLLPTGTPVVSITSPTNNSTFTTGSNITITASASETNGTINSVAYYDGTSLLATETVSPYTYIATNVAAGVYTVDAVATDSTGKTATSSNITVTVSTPVTPTCPVCPTPVVCPAPIICPAPIVCSAPTLSAVSATVVSNGNTYTLTK